MEHKHVTGTRIVEEEIEKENGADSENGGKNDNSVQENGASCEESQCNGNGFLDIPLSKTGHRLSIMEEESVKEKMRVSLLKQCAAILKQGGEKYTKESLHRIFQDRDLLERVFHLFDAERRGRLEQADWVEFLKERLTDDRQLEFVESLETAAFAQRGAGPLHAADFGNLFRSRQVTDRMFRVLDRSGDGVTTAEDIMELLSGVTCSRPRSGYDKSCVDRLEALFRATVGDQREITKEQFKSIMESKNPFFTERVFQIFDEDNSGSISLQEFIAQAHRFAGRAPDQKIQFLFKVYDMDDDGLIQHRELQHVMRACMEENGMRFSEDQLQELTAAMFEDADAARRGAITYEALKEQLERHDGLLENLTISIDRWLVPPKKEEVPPTFTQRLGRLKPYWCSRQYFKNNYVFVGYLLVYFLVNLGLFVSRAVEYREANGYVIVARACGQCLNLTGSWLLVLMLRRGVTWLRARRAGALLPLDHHVYLHKLTGIHLAVYSLVHTGAHLANFSFVVVPDPVLNPGNHTTLEWLFTARPGRFGAVPGCANPTGAALAVILAVMVVFSRPAVRRGGSFEVFYWTHLLYVPFWLLLLFHGPNFWKWFAAPGAAYVVERVTRLFRLERGKTYISSGILLASRVTHVVVRRPALFSFHAGDYVYVNVPAIAAYEWHPFTISSAPEQDEYLWLHIRGVGEWTNRLHRYFEDEHRRLRAAHPTISRTISSPDSKTHKKRSVDFSPLTFNNEAFTLEEETNKPAQHTSLLKAAHLPLEKSMSMPDVQHRTPKKERLSTPGGRDIAEARLAHSFRYLRAKPSFVAFHTPSFDAERGLIYSARRRLSKSISPDKEVEDPNANQTAPDDPPYAKPLESSRDHGPSRAAETSGIQIYLDGPYGAPSSHIFAAQHAALIAAGIGVTPFASILQCIMHRYWNTRNVCPRCRHAWAGDAMAAMRLRKVDFFWINREQRSFEWFVSLLSQLEMEQAELGPSLERFLELHMYITSAFQRGDMRAVHLQLALDLLHEKEKRDLITGLKTRTNAGRPNWDKVFTQLQQQNKGKVTVFYCGPPQLGRVLRVKCDQYGFNFRKEVF